MLGMVVAHELGHTFGMPHDGTPAYMITVDHNNITCPAGGKIMSTYASSTSAYTEFSQVRQIIFINNGAHYRPSSRSYWSCILSCSSSLYTFFFLLHFSVRKSFCVLGLRRTRTALRPVWPTSPPSPGPRSCAATASPRLASSATAAPRARRPAPLIHAAYRNCAC